MDPMDFNLKDITITVIGDFFLDKYLLIDPALNEPSLETGLTAYQVVGKELYPGGAGTVAKNLLALGLGRVICVGVIGEDGEGMELAGELKKLGADLSGLITTPIRQTCTYTKPVELINGAKHEINRLDFKNFTKTPEHIEDELKIKLIEAARVSKAVIAVDQLNERNCGTITEKIRLVLSNLSAQNPDLIVYGDSRKYINEYQNIIIKCNNKEAVYQIHPGYTDENPPMELVKECGRMLYEKNKKTVFITLGKDGMLVFDSIGSCTHVPGFLVEGEIDICGAGDAATTGIVSALAMGKSPCEAALIGNAVASVTIRQLGTTGTATLEQLTETLTNGIRLIY